MEITSRDLPPHRLNGHAQNCNDCPPVNVTLTNYARYFARLAMLNVSAYKAIPLTERLETKYMEQPMDNSARFSQKILILYILVLKVTSGYVFHKD